MYMWIDAEKLTGIELAQGSHQTPKSGLCLMEAVAYVRGMEHTDRPACVSPLLGEMGRSLNDRLPHDMRQQLIPLIPDLPGTAGDGHDEARSYMALDWLIRTYLPAWLDLVPTCREDAAKVRELGRIVDLASAERAGPVVRQAQTNSAAARAAAVDAARDVAVAAAWAAAWGATRVAAWTAAVDAARDAARVAAWTAAVDVASTAGRAAAVAAARAAAVAAARAAALTAAVDALAPTVEQLQRSAIELYGRMARAGHPTTSTEG